MRKYLKYTYIYILAYHHKTSRVSHVCVCVPLPVSDNVFQNCSKGMLLSGSLDCTFCLVLLLFWTSTSNQVVGVLLLRLRFIALRWMFKSNVNYKLLPQRCHNLFFLLTDYKCCSLLTCIYITTSVYICTYIRSTRSVVQRVGSQYTHTHTFGGKRKLFGLILLELCVLSGLIRTVDNYLYELSNCALSENTVVVVSYRKMLIVLSKRFP